MTPRGRRTSPLSHVKPGGFVVSAQNCWNDPVVAGIAGADRSVGLVMSRIGVALWKPGEVERGMERGAGAGHDVFRAGEHDGRDHAARRGARVDAEGDRRRAGNGQPLGRALGQALPERDGQSRAGDDRPRLGGDRGRGARARDHDSPRRGVGAGRAGARPARAELRRLRRRALGGRREARGLSRRSTSRWRARAGAAATGAPRWRRT